MSMLSELFIKLSLKKEGLDTGIDQAKVKVSSLGAIITKVGGIIAGAFTFAKITSFVKSAIQAYDDLAKANAKVGAIIKSTGGAAGVTAEQIKSISGEIKGKMLFGGADVTNASAVLLTFTKIGKTVFPDAMKAAANMSAVLGGDLQSSVIQIGKALQTPSIGLTALRRSGVSFTNEQTELIKKLESSGQLLEAQKMILAELKTEFDGAGEAIAQAGTGPIEMFNKKIKAAKTAIGELIVESQGFKEAMSMMGDYAAAALTDVGDIIYTWTNKNIGFWKKVGITIDESLFGSRGAKFLEEQKIMEKAIRDYDKMEAEAQKPIKPKGLTDPKIYTAAEQLAGQIAYLKDQIKQANTELSKTPAGEEWQQQKDKVDQLNEALKKLTENQKRVKEFSPGAMTMSNAGLAFGSQKEQATSTPIENGVFVVPEVKPGLQGIEKWGKDLEQKIKEILKEITEQAKDPIKEFNSDISNLIKSGLSNSISTLFEGIGEMSVKAMLPKDFGLQMLQIIGNFMVEMGTLMVMFGTGLSQFQTGITSMNPALAIGAGIALIVAGGAISGLAKKGLSNSTSSTNPAASGYNGSSYNQSSAMNTFNGSVVFELHGNALKGALANTDRRNNQYK